MAGCMGSSLEQTPLPAEPETAAPAPASHASQTGTPDAPETTGDDSSDDAAPVSGTRTPSAAPSQKSSAPPSGIRYACRQSAASDRRACDAIVQGSAVERSAGGCNRSVPYCASDLQAAYGLSQAARTGGKGVVVGIVDAYGYAAAASDLATYRKRMGLPGCAISNGCLRIVNQRGRASPLPKSSADAGDDWQTEEALDLDMVSAICPNCRIVLVQANSDKSADLAASVNAAGGLGAIAIVNAYGGKEEGASDAAYRRPGRTVVASAGSAGTGLRAPCSYAAVICVGGTSLAATSSGRGWGERIWRDAASGCSANRSQAVVAARQSLQDARRSGSLRGRRSRDRRCGLRVSRRLAANGWNRHRFGDRCGALRARSGRSSNERAAVGLAPRCDRHVSPSRRCQIRVRRSGRVGNAQWNRRLLTNADACNSFCSADDCVLRGSIAGRYGHHRKFGIDECIRLFDSRLVRWPRDGHAARTRWRRGEHPEAVFRSLQPRRARFFSDLAAARKGNAATVPCMKSASFGSSLHITWQGWTSPDLTCPPKDALGDALVTDVGAIRTAAGISESPARNAGSPNQVPPSE